MGLLDRLLGRGTTLAAPNTPENWRTQDDWLEAWGCPRNLVAGEERCQKDLRKLARCKGRCLRLVDVLFTPEPNNPVDPCAMLASVERKKVGYLRAGVAAGIAEACADSRIRLSPFVVAGVIRGGWDDTDDPGRLGVHVWLDRLITPGPAITIDDPQLFAVSWPPHKDEIAVLQR